MREKCEKVETRKYFSFYVLCTYTIYFHDVKLLFKKSLNNILLYLSVNNNVSEMLHIIFNYMLLPNLNVEDALSSSS